MVDWFTVSYRSIFIAILVVVLVGGGAGYYFWTRNAPAAGVRRRRAARHRHHRPLHHPRRQREGEDGRDVRMGQRRPRDGRCARATSCARDRAPRPRSRSSTGPRCTCARTASSPSRRARRTRGRSSARVAAHISSGEVQFNAPRSTAAGAEREFSTPTLRTTTREAAAGGVSVQESGESNVKLYTGTATVATKTGDTVQLAANTQLKVDAAGKAEPVHSAAAGARAAGAPAPDRDHLPGPGARHDAARVEAGARAPPPTT